MKKSIYVCGVSFLLLTMACQNALNESTEISNCDEAIPSILDSTRVAKSSRKSNDQEFTEFLEWNYDVLSEKLTLLHDNLCAPCGVGDANGYALDYELITTDEGLELQEKIRDVDRFNELKCISCVYDMKLTATVPHKNTKFKVTKETKDFENGSQTVTLFEGELELAKGQGRLPLLTTYNSCVDH